MRSNFPSITQDLIFGHVMSKEKNCLELIRRALPQLNIQRVKVIPQYEINSGLNERNVRLDIWAKDDQGHVYDIEMQTTNKQNFGQRVRYYQSEIDKFTLKAGEDYQDIKPSYIIFLCTFDPFGAGESLYEFQNYDMKTGSIPLNTESYVLFFNATGKTRDLSRKMLDFLDYMNGVQIKSDSYIDKLSHQIVHYVESEE